MTKNIWGQNNESDKNNNNNNNNNNDKKIKSKENKNEQMWRCYSKLKKAEELIFSVSLKGRIER